MKKRVALTVIIALLSNCAHNLSHYRKYEKTKAVIISERVGETIDPGEREQFDLFPEIDNFRTAIFYHIAEGGYEVEILTENKKLTAVNRDTLAIPLLRDYINRYEEIQDSKADFEEKWEIADYDNLGQPITESEITQTQLKRFGCLGGVKDCFTGGLVGCLGGGLISLLAIPILVNINTSDDVVEGQFWLVTAISTVLGAWLGPKISRNDALKAIKESRKPRGIE